MNALLKWMAKNKDKITSGATRLGKSAEAAKGAGKITLEELAEKAAGSSLAKKASAGAGKVKSYHTGMVDDFRGAATGRNKAMEKFDKTGKKMSTEQRIASAIKGAKKAAPYAAAAGGAGAYAALSDDDDDKKKKKRKYLED